MRPTCRCTVGSSAFERAASTAARNAASATPRYTAEMIGIAMLTMTCSGGSITPYGRLASTRSSGTNTSSMTTSWLPVPRMPRVSQLSSTVTPAIGHGHGHVQHARPLVGVVVAEHRRQHGPGR